ncbi:sulfatase [Sphingomonas panacis]|uniref:Sulfatase n=1 Tax=Sphingomonas panacis TaxID=1560345 RepID=A0A1B3ZCT7_9SPHN|nr:sulfatase [Sphingomonas panacis]AOH85241.1 sulfatase [Sphingomonas panacis]
MRKRELLKGAAAAALMGIVPSAGWAQRHPEPKPQGERTNLLFITADDLDSSIPGFMGGMQKLTPNLDALAARAHRFVNNRTVAPICMPSRQAFMTGLLPHHSGGTGFIPVKSDTPTLTTILQDQGYFAAAIHKVDHMQPWSCFPWDYLQNGKDRHTLVHAHGLTVAVEEAKAQNKPFFVQCNINDPHRPFYGSRAAAKADHGNKGPYVIPHEVGPDDVTVPAMLEDLPDVRRELAQYWNSAQRMDLAIGAILRALEESGEAHNTAIVFCADHGMPFPFAKATCYDHGTRVPVLIAWPGMAAPRQFGELTTNLDILPTLLDLLGIAPPSALDGQSWMPLMLGQAFTAPRYQVTYVNEVSSGMAYPSRAIQDDRYALVFQAWADGILQMKLESMFGLTWPAMVAAANGDPKIAARVKQYVEGIPLAFYDLHDDPGQRRNLIGEKRHVARIAAMRTALLAEMRRTSDPQFANLQAAIAGKPMNVPQDPARFRISGGGGE